MEFALNEVHSSSTHSHEHLSFCLDTRMQSLSSLIASLSPFPPTRPVRSASISARSVRPSTRVVALDKPQALRSSCCTLELMKRCRAPRLCFFLAVSRYYIFFLFSTEGNRRCIVCGIAHGLSTVYAKWELSHRVLLLGHVKQSSPYRLHVAHIKGEDI